MRIDPLDPEKLDDSTAERLAELQNRAQAIDAPHLPPVTGRHLQLMMRYGWDNRPFDHLLIATDERDATVGRVQVELPYWDNQHVAVVDMVTAPTAAPEVGDALLESTQSLVAAVGRTMLLADAWRGSERERFWSRHGFEVGSSSAQRRLVLGDLDHPELARLLGESERRSADYDLDVVPNPAPASLMPGLVDLHLAMNDSPLDDLELEDDVWNEERLRGYETAMSLRGYRLYRLVARRRSDGVLGGHTVVVVEDERPWFAFQEDTAVVRGHRGHRLGMRLKVAMLDLLAKEEPQIQFIDTWNAESNAHMLAVNDTMGYVVAGRAVEVQKKLR